MVLYFSARILQAQSSGGIVGYLLGLLEALAEQPGLEIHAGLNPSSFHELGRQMPGSVIRHSLSGSQNEQWAAREYELMGKINPDWVIYSYPDTLDMLNSRGFKTATCVPDLQHLAYPFFFAPGERARRDAAFGDALGSADLIFTLSEFVRHDLVRVYGCDEERIHVVYPSATPRFLDGGATPEAIAQVRAKFALPERYAIFPGNFWRHKNHAKLLEALSLLQSRGTTVPLVLSGDVSLAEPGLREQIVRAMREGWLIVPGYVKNDELHALISGAECLLFPSLFEGFGIPVAEAMAVGVPVVCSNVCSLPEVGGDVARYFDPLDAESIANAVEKQWNDKDATLPERARAQSRRFNYRDSAAVFLRSLTDTPARPGGRKHQEIAVDEPLLVSIVTPSYQQGQFLRHCIESVLTQDYPHIEYCVMDGGSTDESRAILESYGNRFYWQSGRDGGQTNAINAGLRRAKGTILAYLNSDDILLPGAISTVVDEWRRKPSVDMFYGSAKFIDESGATIDEYKTQEFDLQTFKALCYICQPSAFWHRRVVEQFGVFDETFQMGMDYEYWQRIAAGGGLISRLDEFLSCSRDYHTTKTRSQRDKVYRDIFRSQWKHWGRIHPNWWVGLADYLKNERRGAWRALGILSKKRQWRLCDILAKNVKQKSHPMNRKRKGA